MRRGVVLASMLLAGWSNVSRSAEETKATDKTAAARAAEQGAKAGAPAPSAPGIDTKETLSSVQLASGDYRVRLGAVIQADGRFFIDDKEKKGIDSFFLRRAQMSCQGAIGKYADFYFSPDFGMGKAVLAEVQIDFRFANAARLRMGRMKVPISLEWLQSSRMVLLLERSLPAGLAPLRDQGLMLFGSPLKGRVSYALGVFNGTIDGISTDIDTDDSKDLVARVMLQPFAPNKSSRFSGLSFGLAASTQKRVGVAPAYKSAGQLSTFSYVKDASADGRYSRLAPQGYVYSGPLGFQAEFVRSAQDVMLSKQRTRVTHDAWSAIASVVVKGGKSGFDNVKITHPFEPGSGHWGALQLAARIEGFDADGDAFSQGLADPQQSVRRARGFGLGLHWYPSQSFRWSIVYSRTTFLGGAKTGDRPAENTLQMRSQVTF